jgi:hypothetical protein
MQLAQLIKTRLYGIQNLKGLGSKSLLLTKGAIFFTIARVMAGNAAPKLEIMESLL